MRERLGNILDMWTEAGITPARAGKTATMTPVICTSEDHPRSCGKDVNKLLEEKRNKGSPPLVRERLRLRISKNFQCRITPARAGKTLSVIFSDQGIEDHPRSCGKDGSPLPFNAPGEGSPPLVRERPGYIHCISF